MKKIIVFISSAFLVSSQALCYAIELDDTHFTGALTTGYVFKNDHVFHEIYGLGLPNAITVDGCFNHCQRWGVGAKVSYWSAHGLTTFIKKDTSLQEVPITFYIRAMHHFKRGLRLYGSLGAGALWMKETSCLDCVRKWRGIGEAEIGINYPIKGHVNFTSAFRYLFPREGHHPKKDVGGFDLRAGLGFSY